MQTIHDFVHKHNVRMSCKKAASNPHMTGSHDMDHWRCTLTCGKRRMSVTFSMGSGHHGKHPTAEEVLSTIAMDASSYENNHDFESWASEYGYDADSRSAHKTFNAVKKQAASLKKFAGSAYEELLYETESL
jgi:hypothetical protein